MRLSKNSIDVSQVFLVFMSLVGDVERTALALDLDPKFVEKLAAEEGWAQKIRRISVMSKSEKPGDWEKAQNRALCFVQAHQASMLIDRFLHLLNIKDDLGIEACATHVSKDGSQKYVSARFLADITSAMEKLQHLKYTALGDTAGERKTEEKQSGEQAAGSIHAAVIAALSSVPMTRQETKAIVIEATTKKVEQIAEDVAEDVVKVQDALKAAKLPLDA